MKFLKSKLIEIQSLLMLCSTIVNILFYLDIASQQVAQFGFIVVILFGIFLNLSSANNRKNNIKINVNVNKSRLEIIVTSIITICWALSYVLTVF